VAESVGGTKFYLDNTYKVLPSGNKVIWENQISKNGAYYLILGEYDCNQARWRRLEVLNYDSQSNLKNSVKINDGELPWETIVPESVGEAKYRKVCSIKSFAPAAPPTSYRPEKQVASPTAKDDIGVDYGIVTSVRANLREGPGTDYATVLGIPKGDMVVLLDGGDDSGWYNVIHVKSNSEGFIHESTISVYLTQNPKPPMTIQGYYAGGSGSPSVDVNNDTSKVMTLKMNETKYVFSPGEIKTLTLTPGRYLFHASAPNVIPDFGDQDFQTGHKYTWRFYIVTRRR
jgi:hypothetical protein